MALSRRALLRGFGLAGATTIALPMMEAMLDRHGEALADGSPLPTRFLTWFFGNGVILQQFEPTQVGAIWEISPELAPLANVKDYVSVLTGMANRCESLITHHEGMTAFNGYTFIEDPSEQLSSVAGGPTIDQVLADRVSAGTSTASIQIGISRKLSKMDNGTTMHVLSHRGPAQPLPPEFNPQAMWRTMFGEFIPRPDDKALRMSVLDSVRQDTLRLKDRLGQLDRQRLDAHLEGVRALEEKIQALPPNCTIPDMPEEDNAEGNQAEPLVAVNEAMSDLLIEAFKCDVTRVASVLFLGGAAETIFTDLGHPTEHHVNTHDNGAQDLVHEGVVYTMQRFAYLLERMQSEVDATGKNLLDTSIVYASSDCAEGITHSVERQPVILVGTGRDKLTYPGVHLQAAPPDAGASGNITDALLTVARCFDPTIPSIGAGAPMSTSILPALTGERFEG